MSFCNLSLGFKKWASTNIPNLFIEKYFNSNTKILYLLVYIYGIYLAQNNYSDSNKPSAIAEKLGISHESVLEAFKFWQDEELLSIDAPENPLDSPDINYMPIFPKKNDKSISYDSSKYSKFVDQLNEVFDKQGKSLNSNNLISVIDDMERWEVTQEASCKILDYANKKHAGTLTLGKLHGILKEFGMTHNTTPEDVDRHILYLDVIKGDMGQILKALNPKLTYNISFSEMGSYIELYNNWIKDFDLETIIEVCKHFKQKGSLTDLNDLLNELALEINATKKDDVKDALEFIDESLVIAKQIIKTLGTFDKYDAIAKNYVRDWMVMGFDKKGLTEIAKHCFMSNYKSVNIMNQFLTNLHKRGLISNDKIVDYIKQICKYDDKITEIMNVSSSHVNLSNSEREHYKMFIEDWKFSHEIILMVTSKQKQIQSRTQIFTWLNRVLSDMKNSKISTFSEAEKYIEDLIARTNYKKQGKGTSKKGDTSTSIDTSIYKADLVKVDVDELNKMIIDDILFFGKAARTATEDDIISYISLQKKYDYERPVLVVAAELLSFDPFNWDNIDKLLSRFKEHDVVDYDSAMEFVENNPLS
ncbi:MAG: DnaD domain protein [Christensenellaceae bacterium]|jgi:hypothetical protein|nr:DnaD domain protein [Christensenellaceae bacterium]